MENQTPYMIELYDEEFGFNAWHLECQRKFKRRHIAPGYSKFYTQGFDKLNVLSPAMVDRVLSRLKPLQNDDRSTWTDPHVEWIHYHHRKDEDWIHELLRHVFNEEMDRILINFFRSEYMVHSLGFQRTFPVDPSKDYSYMWHRDAGPTAHLKIIVYFTSGKETGAGTELLDVNISDRVADVGYAFPRLDERTSDLAPFLERAGIASIPSQDHVEAGDAIVFRPRDALHRGRFTNNADKPRYAMSMVIAPSTMQWQWAMKLWPLFVAQRAVGVRIDPAYAPVLRGESRVNVPDD